RPARRIALGHHVPGRAVPVDPEALPLRRPAAGESPPGHSVQGGNQAVQTSSNHKKSIVERRLQASSALSASKSLILENARASSNSTSTQALACSQPNRRLSLLSSKWGRRLTSIPGLHRKIPWCVLPGVVAMAQSYASSESAWARRRTKSSGSKGVSQGTTSKPSSFA